MALPWPKHHSIRELFQEWHVETHKWHLLPNISPLDQASDNVGRLLNRRWQLPRNVNQWRQEWATFPQQQIERVPDLCEEELCHSDACHVINGSCSIDSAILNFESCYWVWPELFRRYLLYMAVKGVSK